MKNRIRAAYAVVDDIANHAGATRVGVVASGTAFYILLAILPATVALGLLLSTFLLPKDVSEVADNISDTLGQVTTSDIDNDIWTQVSEFTANASYTGVFTISGIFAILLALYSSSRVVVTFRQTLDAVFDVEVERGGLFLRAIAAVIALVFLVVTAATIIGLVILPRIIAEMTGFTVSFGSSWWNWLLLFLIALVVVKLLFQYGPHRADKSVPRPHVAWSSVGVWMAAVWVVVAVAAVGFIIQLSSGSMNIVLVFGAPVFIMLWLNALLIGVLTGAEVTAWERRRVTG